VLCSNLLLEVLLLTLGYALQQALGNELARLAGRHDRASPGPSRSSRKSS
jgi:hypothetical protein